MADGIDVYPLRTLYDNALMGQSKLTDGYQFTNGDTIKVIRDLYQKAAVPLGPLFKRVPERAPEVAVLESFATAAMGGPASWGWLSPAITFFQRARLDPRVVYEETILRDGFGRT